MLTKSTNPHMTLRASKLAVSLIVFFATAAAYAQFGISPSQTSSYFDDFRGRASHMQQAGSGVRSGDVVYDYDSGTYTGADGESQMRPEDLLREARSIAQPSVYSGSGAVASRAVGDYTNYSGQYTSSTGYFAPTYTSDPFLSGRRNLKLGPVNVGLGLYQGLEWNSNINRASGNARLSDFISTTLFNVDANYRVTKNNVLSLTTSIGFDHYFNNPQSSPYGGGNMVLNILPGSTLAFDMKIGPVYVTFYDRVAVRPAVSNAFTLNTQNIFGVFQNDLGAVMNWAVNSKWTASLSFNNSYANSLDGRFDIYNRIINTISGNITYSPHGTWSAGIESSYSSLRYEQPALNDGDTFTLGAFFRTQLGSATYLKMAAGYQGMQFSKPTTLLAPAIGDFNDLDDYYFNFSITNQINNRLSHTLSLGHESALNLTSNFITADYINYGVSIITSKGGRLSLTGYYEDATPSSERNQSSIRQYGLDAYYSHQITSKVRMGLGYHYGHSAPPDTSIFPGQGFGQHAFNVDFGWALTQKSSINMGYRYFTTRADNSGLNFDQHRVILGYTYNF